MFAGDIIAERWNAIAVTWNPIVVSWKRIAVMWDCLARWWDWLDVSWNQSGLQCASACVLTTQNCAGVGWDRFGFRGMYLIRETGCSKPL